MRRPIICLDIDGTIADTASFLRLAHARLGTPLEPTRYDIFHNIPEGDVEEFMNARETRRVLAEMTPFAGVRDRLLRWTASLAEVNLVTSRPKTHRAETIEWLRANDLRYTSLRFVTNGKGKFCADLGAEVMFEDSPGEISDLLVHGVPTVAIEHAYNREFLKGLTDDERPTVINTTDWGDAATIANVMAEVGVSIG